MYATMKQRKDWTPAVRHNRSQNAGVVYTLEKEIVAVDALMRFSFRTESDATRGITAEQNIRGFRPMSAAMSACRVRLTAVHATWGRLGTWSVRSRQCSSPQTFPQRSPITQASLASHVWG